MIKSLKLIAEFEAFIKIVFFSSKFCLHLGVPHEQNRIFDKILWLVRLRR